MDFVFDQLRSYASMSPNLELDDTPVLDSLFSDPFASSMTGEDSLEIVIKRTNLLMNSTNSSGLLSGSGGPIYIRRVFLKSINFLDYRYVGWVLDVDMVICMICSEEFSLFTRRHHCRICGDVICDSCSNQTIFISEIKECGPVRVCNCCFYGQEETSITALVHSYGNYHQADNFPDDESIFSRSDPTLSTLIGTPYVVMKSRKISNRSQSSDGNKVFINVCYHSLIVGKNSIVIGEDCPKEIVGKSGEYCFVYDVCVSLDSLEQDQAHLDQFFHRVISVLNRRYRAGLDLSYIILRTKKNFKGDHIPHFLLRLGDGQVVHEHSQLHLCSPLGFFDEAAQKCPLPLSPSSLEPLTEHPNEFSERSNSRTISSDEHSINQPAPPERPGSVLTPLAPETHTPTPLSLPATTTSQEKEQEKSSPPPSPPAEHPQDQEGTPLNSVPATATATGLAESNDGLKDTPLLAPILSLSPEPSLKIPCPEMYSGWMRRQEGSLISSFAKRFFVLEKCLLTCYEMSADTPPYGRSPKGVFQLTHATQIDLISTPVSSPTAATADALGAQSSPRRTSLFKKLHKKKSLTQTQLLLSDPLRRSARESSGGGAGANDPEEYLLEVESIENHARWVQALLLHIEYCTASKRRFSMP